MAEGNMFEKLVNHLSSDERADLLEKISSNYTVSSIPLEEEESVVESSVDEAYTKLGFLHKLFIFILSVINSKPKKEILLQMMLDNLAKKIIRRNPHLLNHADKQVATGFYRALCVMKESFKPLKEMLRFALLEERKDYIAFLASFELEDIQDQLLSLNVWKITEQNPGAGEHEIRRLLDNQVNALFESISQEQRERMYAHWKNLDSFSQIINYPFHLLLNHFTVVDDGEVGYSPYGTIGRTLSEFCNLFSTFYSPPDAVVLESLIIFFSERNVEDHKDDLDSLIREYSKTATFAVDSIRKFKENVPLVDIVRISTRDLWYHPEFSVKGEDWFSLYKRFWNGKIDEIFRNFLQERKRIQLVDEAKAILPDKRMLVLNYYNEENHWEGIKPAYPLAIRFLYTYMQHVFNPRILKLLKILLIDGDFYKKQNREELAEAYKILLLLSEEMISLDNMLAEEGELGIELSTIIAEMVSAKIRVKKVGSMIRRIDGMVSVLIRKAVDNFNLIASIVHGVLYGEVGGRYDSLANLGNLGGKNNKSLLISLGNLQTELEAAGHILINLLTLEKGNVTEVKQ